MVTTPSSAVEPYHVVTEVEVSSATSRELQGVQINSGGQNVLYKYLFSRGRQSTGLWDIFNVARGKRLSNRLTLKYAETIVFNVSPC
jgi:hypothetical protein